MRACAFHLVSRSIRVRRSCGGRFGVDAVRCAMSLSFALGLITIPGSQTDSRIASPDRLPLSTEWAPHMAKPRKSRPRKSKVAGPRAGAPGTPPAPAKAATARPGRNLAIVDTEELGLRMR